MTLLNIYLLDDTDQKSVIASLPEGKHIIGRGDLLHVTDKRVSRKHAIIEVSDEKITLTSVHVNPCFFKAVNGKTLTVLTQNQQNVLSDGDQFALLPEDYWFRVKIQRGDQEVPHLNGKRSNDTHLEEISDTKRARLSNESIVNQPSTSHITEESINNHSINASYGNQNESMVDNIENQPSTSHIKEEQEKDNNDTSHNSQVEQVKPEQNEEESNSSLHFQETARVEDVAVEKIKKEPDSSQEENNVSIEGTTEAVKEEPLNNDENNPPLAGNTDEDNAQPTAKTENNDNKNPVGSGSSVGTGSGSGGTNLQPKPQRERCWYGNRCFRKNPNHRDTFSHPGDQDYESDPDNDRPDCPYGAACYRQNIDHRREYKHVAKPAPKPRRRSTTPSPPGSPSTQNSPTNKKKPQRKRNTKKAKQPSYDSEDDYDYDDPFLNDGSSDDFEPTDDSSDSDWEDSQEVDEESQERKRMLREARKFTKNKKKD